MAETQATATTTGATAQASVSDQAGAVFTNRDLFSGYYLGTLLAREVRTRQGETGARMSLPTRRRLIRLWEDVSTRFGATTGYARTRQAWLEPLLTALGYEPLVEARASDFAEENLPSGYFLHQPRSAEAQDAQPRAGIAPADIWATAIVEPASAAPDADNADEDADEATATDDAASIDEAPDSPAAPGGVLLSLLAWDDDFDRPFSSARRRSETPHKLMERLLASGPAMWGILLNGQKARLLKRNVVSGRQQYLEVDLEALFDGGSDRDFDTFWTLFRAQAFEPDATGRSLMEVVDEGSRTHAERVSATLKTSVFGAMERLMAALVERAQDIRRTPPAPEDAAGMARFQTAERALRDLKQLYEQSLILLYRMLFVLYAESRELLPTDNPVYRDSYSLEPLRDEVERPGVTYEPDSFRLWESAQALFRLIHYGCRTTDLVVPAYNGALFRPESVALLNALRVPDDAMAEVIRLLSLTPATKDRGRERISYRDLDVEQLGAVYEGLLEFEPRVASEPMVEVRYKDQLAVIPARERRDYTVLRQFAPGHFYLGRGAGRKTTGSYYTPQPLVEFLVKRTLEPLVEEKSADEILDLRVVDAAMGSGAFLVGACSFLAEAYARALQREQSAIRAAVGDIELDAEPAGEEGEEQALTEEAIRPYRRLVAERCIYGVDLNPMAVELAKVSLWLTTLAGDKPLTFLDAHLRCGNSLIGASLHPWTDASGARQYSIDTIHPEANKRLQKGRGGASRGRAREDGRQLHLFAEEEVRATVEPLVGRLNWIATTPSDSVERVHEKEELYRQQVEGDRQRAQLKAVCDLWVASWFWRQPPADAKPDDPRYALPLDGPIYRQLAQRLRGREGFGIPESAMASYLAEAMRVAAEVRPFHWELEFPEVFYEQDGARREHPGFDAILGNPPWDTVAPNSKEFFSVYDPGFRMIERVAAQRRQEELLADPDISTAWQRYVEELDAANDFYRVSELFPYQNVPIDGKESGVQYNTYKLFLERSYNLLRQGGGCGIIVPSGLYTDQGCTGLRQLFLTRSRITSLLCFENRRKVFPIDSRFKFVLFSFRREQHDDAVPAAFMQHDMDILSSPEARLVLLPSDLIRRLSPDTLSFMEFRSQNDVDVVERIYGRWPLLGERLDSTWNVEFTQEVNLTHDREILNQRNAGWPLYEGKMVHQYTDRHADPGYWIEIPRFRPELARRALPQLERALDNVAKQSGLEMPKASRKERITELLRRVGRGPLTEHDVRIAGEAPRLAFREVAAGTNERTMIASILPAKSFSAHTLLRLEPWTVDAIAAMENPEAMASAFVPSLPASTMAYLCGVFNSFSLDFALRFKVTSHVSQFYVYQLPVPRLMPGDPRLEAIAERVGRLVCIGPEFDALRRELLGDVHAHVATDEEERQALKNEIDALVAHLYGLSEDDLAHILYAPYTFPLVKRAVKDGVMAAYRQVEMGKVKER